MHTLYLLGGSPRTAKTTIMAGLAKEKGIAYIAADAVEHGMRNVLTGEPHQMLRDIELAGSAVWKTSINESGERKPFSNKGTESELTLQAVIGMIDYYRRNQESIAFEGAVFTPKWIKSLKLDGFTIRAAFVGYTNTAHVDNIIDHANENSHDWIKNWLERNGGDETKIREWAAKQTDKCIELKAEAEQLGYPFFDISTKPFLEYITSVQNYFLEK